MTQVTEAVTVSLLIENPNENLLFQKRDDKPGLPYPGAWALIGGFKESTDADEFSALMREVREELALAEEDVRQLSMEWPPRFLGKESFWEQARGMKITSHVWLWRTKRMNAEHFTCLEGQGLKFFQVALACPAASEPFKKGTPSTRKAIIMWALLKKLGA